MYSSYSRIKCGGDWVVIARGVYSPDRPEAGHPGHVPFSSAAQSTPQGQQALGTEWVCA